MLTKTQLLPCSDATITIASTANEIAAHVGVRSVSWYHHATIPQTQLAAERAAFVLDVARATTAAIVEECIGTLAPDLPPVDTLETGGMEVDRLDDALMEVAFMPRAASASAERDALRAAAMAYAAAILRQRAVRW